ncbi:hypothetical protein ATANTOWER_019500 [Ataeniobius toweri]|uniref:DUF4430 domain-containing protein n=1 Tax=Ataeniobius toweri TaxID=208326 RepID=A0ABU7BJJ0_9TELE|nr:hypothetical protein [Ataeniobius toweri]
MKTVLFLTTLLLLLPSGTLTRSYEPVPIEVLVKNSLLNNNPVTYRTEVVPGWILLGAMRKLMDSDVNFKFTYSDDPHYGPFLESVNGLAGKPEDRTYWELLVKVPGGSIIRPNVGIGCYIPNQNEQIIFNFTKW